MECEDSYYGRIVGFPGWKADAGRPRALKRKHAADEVDLDRMDVVAAAGDAPAQQPATLAVVPADLPARALHAAPFMNRMDEIAFWVNTRRAPCLMNYDGLAKNYFESKVDSKLVKPNAEVSPSPTKKKRKVAVFEEECISEKRQNVYFEAPEKEQPEQRVLSSCKSATVESEIDFIIRNSSIQEKSKIKVGKSHRRLHKKNKVITSTPVRRSLRKAQNYIVYNDQLNMSNETYLVTHGTLSRDNSKSVQKLNHRSKKLIDKTPERGDTGFDNKKSLMKWNKPNDDTQNNQFEDLSDVSGFTANYIRSTKVNNNVKCPRNLRSKSKRNLMKESHQHSSKADGNLVLFVNKGVNATNNNNTALNCSTDSSQNVLNLITTQISDENCKKVDRSTSLLKFINLKSPRENQDVETGQSSLIKVIDLDVSYQSKSTNMTRYPRRNKSFTHNENMTVDSVPSNIVTKASVENKKKSCSRNHSAQVKLDKYDDLKEKGHYRTRSGRNCSQRVQQPESNVLVYCNSAEQLSDSVNTLNVGVQTNESKIQMKSKRLCTSKYASHARKSVDRWYRNSSVREKSGFSACFSDSDDGEEAQKHRKYFC